MKVWLEYGVELTTSDLNKLAEYHGVTGREAIRRWLREYGEASLRILREEPEAWIPDGEVRRKQRDTT